MGAGFWHCRMSLSIVAHQLNAGLLRADYLADGRRSTTTTMAVPAFAVVIK